MATESLAAAGPPLHPPDEASRSHESLGWVFEGVEGAARPKSRRLWRLRVGTLALLEKGKATGRQISKIVGHFTFAGLARRQFLSVFDAAHRVASKYRGVSKPLSEGVRREL
eukprot:6549352-Pyramimonas_sp.AAC.1